MSGDGESHRPTRRASANAANTFSGSAAKRRRTSKWVLSALIARNLRQQPIELTDRPFPKTLVTRDPSPRLSMRPLVQPKPIDSPFDRAFNVPGSIPDFQVVRHRVLGYSELTPE